MTASRTAIGAAVLAGLALSLTAPAPRHAAQPVETVEAVALGASPARPAVDRVAPATAGPRAASSAAATQRAQPTPGSGCSVGRAHAYRQPATQRGDWVVVTIRSGPSGARIASASTTLTYVQPGPDASVLGVAEVDTATGEAAAATRTFKQSSLTASTTSRLGGLRHQVVVNPQPVRSKVSSSLATQLGPCQRNRLLLLAPHGQLTGLTSSLQVAAGTADLQVVFGSGSVSASSADPANGGAALAVGPVAVGQSSLQAHPRTAIVGGRDDACLCMGTWQAPAAAERPWQSPGGPVNGAFAGGAGTWHWTFTGAQAPVSTPSTDQPAYVAWAPLGALADDWIRALG